MVSSGHGRAFPPGTGTGQGDKGNGTAAESLSACSADDGLKCRCTMHPYTMFWHGRHFKSDSLRRQSPPPHVLCVKGKEKGVRPGLYSYAPGRTPVWARMWKLFLLHNGCRLVSKSPGISDERLGSSELEKHIKAHGHMIVIIRDVEGDDFFFVPAVKLH